MVTTDDGAEVLTYFTADILAFFVANDQGFSVMGDYGAAIGIGVRLACFEFFVGRYLAVLLFGQASLVHLAC